MTGDLVDSPWRWGRRSLGRARDKLYEARRRVEEEREVAFGSAHKQCSLLVVPGNHDTRIRGLAPLRRLFTPLICCLVIAIVAAVVAHPLGGFRSAILWGALIAMALVWLAYAVPFGRFYRCFPANEAVTEPSTVRCGDVTVEVFPFDSASFPIVLAGGQVQLDEFVRSRRVPKADRTRRIVRQASCTAWLPCITTLCRSRTTTPWRRPWCCGTRARSSSRWPSSTCA